MKIKIIQRRAEGGEDLLRLKEKIRDAGRRKNPKSGVFVSLPAGKIQRSKTKRSRDPPIKNQRSKTYCTLRVPIYSLIRNWYQRNQSIQHSDRQ